MRRSWVIAGGLLFWVGCTTSMKVGDDGPGGSASESTSSSTGDSSSSSSSAAVGSSSSTGSGDPCSGVACTTPDAPECISATMLRVRLPAGTCSAGACSYPTTDVVCANGCSAGGCSMGPTPTTLSACGVQTCAAVAGGVQCWGNHGWDALDFTLVPIAKDLVPTNIVSIGLGVQNACAIGDLGALVCWSRNNLGQLGDGTQTDTDIPVTPVGLSSGVAAVASSGTHTCAITFDGSVLCWGSNSYGEIGPHAAMGFLAISTVPVGVLGPGSAVAVSLGERHSCALTPAGSVKCWGNNDNGALGDGTTTWSTLPVDVVGLSSGVVAISSANDQTCAVLATGGLRCWGYNSAGQLGNGSQTGSAVPVDVIGLSSGVIAVAVGAEHTCALLSTGAVKCWGYNEVGQLGNAVVNVSPAPVDVNGLPSAAVAIAAGNEHSCATLANGKIMCWGFNGSGQLGNNSTVSSFVPVEVVGF